MRLQPLTEAKGGKAKPNQEGLLSRSLTGAEDWCRDIEADSLQETKGERR